MKRVDIAKRIVEDALRQAWLLLRRGASAFSVSASLLVATLGMRTSGAKGAWAGG